jgi:hypothetical protein
MIGIKLNKLKTIIMLKNILKLKGVQKLSDELQKTVKGGQAYCFHRITGECISSAPVCIRICGDFPI